MNRIVGMIALLLVVSAAFAEDYRGWTESRYGHFRIESVSEDGGGDYWYAEVIVSYANTTDATFDAVTFRAIIYDDNRRVVATNRRSFYEQTDGPIMPGFEGVVEIPVEIERHVLESVAVSISGR